MELSKILTKIRRHDNCQLLFPTGLPDLNSGHILPADLLEFYNECGGGSLHMNSRQAFHIVKPENFVLANPVIIGGLCPNDISSQWYIVAVSDEGEYITIDLNTKRLGRCYDSFWDCHGVDGECDIVANNFTELLWNLFKLKGEYWKSPKFQPIGDAYEDNPIP